jgi:hypothetical protein
LLAVIKLNINYSAFIFTISCRTEAGSEGYICHFTFILAHTKTYGYHGDKKSCMKVWNILFWHPQRTMVKWHTVTSLQTLSRVCKSQKKSCLMNVNWKVASARRFHAYFVIIRTSIFSNKFSVENEFFKNNFTKISLFLHYHVTNRTPWRMESCQVAWRHRATEKHCGDSYMIMTYSAHLHTDYDQACTDVFLTCLNIYYLVNQYLSVSQSIFFR